MPFMPHLALHLQYMSARCYFKPAIYHPNVDPRNGRIYLSTIAAEGHWKPSITMKQMLIAIQELLEEPNVHVYANESARLAFTEQRHEYDKKVRKLVKKMDSY